MSTTIFTIKRSEIEKRLDPFFYRPDFMQLENAIKKAGALPLRNYVRGIASGATPKTDEYEKYYSDKQNGIPFLRVQNLSPTSILNYEDCKYINKETHENMLYRSQVNEGDLLVKITGVGRMAVASVAPKDFVGNTNQHMCVIKTDDERTSWILAAWLNTDIAEKLASRRATGGTRPALDYPALLSIPVIFDERIYETMKNAVSKMKIKQQQAKQLLDSIDSYLLSELGIKLPQKDNSLSKRIFTTKFSEVSGGRWDPFWQISQKNKMKSNNFSEFKVKELANIQKGESITSDEIKEGNFPVIAGGKTSPYSHNVSNFNGNVITISASGAYSGYVWYHKKPIFASDCSVLTSLDESNCTTLFLYEVLHLKQEELYNLQQGAGQPHVYPDDIAEIKIPLPPLPKQKEIASHIREIREQAKQLQVEAEQTMQEAKKQIEKMILGE